MTTKKEFWLTEACFIGAFITVLIIPENWNFVAWGTLFSIGTFIAGFSEGKKGEKLK